MSSLPLNPNQSVRARNPHLYPPGGVESAHRERRPSSASAGKRLRQSSRPLLNKLEQEWFDLLNMRANYPPVRAQSIRFRLCNGVVYTPDVFCLSWARTDGPDQPTAWEVKGKHAWDDAIVKLKMAAHEWPDIHWVLVWKEGGQWCEQDVLP